MGQVHRRQACLVGTRVKTGWLEPCQLERSQVETRGMGLPEMERVGQQPHPQPAQHDRQQDLRRESLPQQQPGQQRREGGVEVLDHRGGPQR